VNVITDVIPYVVIALLLVVVAARRSRSARGPLSRPGRGRAVAALSADSPPALRLLPLPGDIGLVAARELRTRVRGRVFRTSTLLILVIVAAAIVVPTLLSSKASTQRVGVAGPLSAPIRAAVVADGGAVGGTVQIVAEPSGQAASADLRAGRINLAIVDGRQVLVAKTVAASDTSAAAELTRAVARTVGSAEAMQAAGLTTAQATAVAGARPLPVSALTPSGPGVTSRNATFVGLVLLFFMLTQYNAWTLTGVLEEKSSRVVEVLLAAITPARLLAGKVLGIGLTAFVQAGVAAATAVIASQATHSRALAGITPTAVVSALVWLVLGYAFYSWVYAAAGSTADRQEQAQSLLLPLSLPVLFSYVLAASTITSGNPSPLFRVLAYLPPTAPFAMPVLVSLGAVAAWQFALSVVVSVACTIGLARGAVAVYQASVLQAGRRVGVRALIARRGTAPPPSLDGS
jgi:ABC-2 type transport system permease protein